MSGGLVWGGEDQAGAGAELAYRKQACRVLAPPNLPAKTALHDLFRRTHA